MSPTDYSSNHTVVWGVLRVIFTGVFPHEAVMLYALFVTHNCRDLKYVTTYTEQCNACACHAINSKNTLIIWNIGKLKTIDPSIHLLPLICGQISGLRHEAQISFFPATSFNSSGVIFETFPGQPEDKVSPVCHGSYLGSPPGGTCPDPITREMSRLHPCPSHLTYLLSIQLYFERACPRWPSFSPYPKVRARTLYSGICSFVHDPQVMNIGEGKEVGKLRPFPFDSAPSSPWMFLTGLFTKERVKTNLKKYNYMNFWIASANRIHQIMVSFCFVTLL